MSVRFRFRCSVDRVGAAVGLARRSRGGVPWMNPSCVLLSLAFDVFRPFLCARSFASALLLRALNRIEDPRCREPESLRGAGGVPARARLPHLQPQEQRRNVRAKMMIAKTTIAPGYRLVCCSVRQSGWWFDCLVSLIDVFVEEPSSSPIDRLIRYIKRNVDICWGQSNIFLSCHLLRSKQQFFVCSLLFLGVGRGVCVFSAN